MKTAALVALALAISISPTVLSEYGSLWLTCRVGRDARNRTLEYGVVDYVSSLRELAGVYAPVTWQLRMDRVPCDVGPAFCLVSRSDGSRERVIADFLVSGCVR